MHSFVIFWGVIHLRSLFLIDYTLVKFRKRLGEEGFREVFNELVKLADEVQLLSKFRIIDATHINALGKKLGFIKFIREGIKRVIKRIRDNEVRDKLQQEFYGLKLKTKAKAREVGKRFVKSVLELKEVSQDIKRVVEAMKLALSGDSRVNFVDVEARCAQ